MSRKRITWISPTGSAHFVGLAWAAIVFVFVFSACSQHRIQTIDKQIYSSDGSHIVVVEGLEVVPTDEAPADGRMVDDFTPDLIDVGGHHQCTNAQRCDPRSAAAKRTVR